MQDGHIDFREFMIVLYVMSNGSPEENLKQIFRVFDINNDGSISLKVSHSLMITYLIFITDTTDGVCVKKLPGVNFYRFNAKNWQFIVYFALITQKIGNLLCILS